MKTFEQFLATAKFATDLGKATGQDTAPHGFVFDQGCYVEMMHDGRFYVGVGNSERICGEMKDAARFLYVQHYVPENCKAKDLKDFVVTLQETVEYKVNVKAESEERAIADAIAIWQQCADNSVYYVHSDGVEAVKAQEA